MLYFIGRLNYACSKNYLYFWSGRFSYFLKVGKEYWIDLDSIYKDKDNSIYVRVYEDAYKQGEVGVPCCHILAVKASSILLKSLRFMN